MIISQFSIYLSSIRDEILEYVPKNQIPNSVYNVIGVKIDEIERLFSSYDTLLEQKKDNGNDPRFQL